MIHMLARALHAIARFASPFLVILPESFEE